MYFKKAKNKLTRFAAIKHVKRSEHDQIPERITPLNNFTEFINPNTGEVVEMHIAL